MSRIGSLLGLTATLAAAAALIAAPSACAQSAGPNVPAGTSEASPAAASPGHASLVNTNFADPGFMAVNGSYYLFRTGTGFGTISSTSPQSGYSSVTNSMANIPAWVDSSNPLLWAPSVFHSSDSQGTLYVMYFTGESKQYGIHCVGVATSRQPNSGFVAQSTPAVCSPKRSSGYEAIDPSPYRTEDGSRWMLYKSDYQNASGFQILAAPMDSQTGTKVTGSSVVKISSSTKMEAPSATLHDGTVYIFTSRGDYVDCSYNTDVWSAHTFAGPFTQLKTVLTTANTGLCGPGGATVIEDGSTTRIAFHVYPDADHNGVKDNSTRQTWVGELRWNSSGPYLY